jgi:thiamine biosynthesis lipoprotein
MGTTFRIVLYAPGEAPAKLASDAAFARIAELDQKLSDYKEDSELMRLCKQAGGPPVPVSTEVFAVLAESQQLSRRSTGAFDVTSGPVIRLWRRARRQRELPDEKRLTDACALVGFDKLLLDEKAHTVQLKKPGMLLDLGGIAKGYAADEAQVVLKKHGVASSLVAAGGDIVVTAPPPDAKGWTIGILPLEGSGQASTKQLVLHDAAVSTSGDLEQFVEIGGVRYSHIIDPRTGQAVTGRHSVTVVAKRGIASDSLATAVSVLGVEKGMALIEATDDAACLFVEASMRASSMHASKRWLTLQAK